MRIDDWPINRIMQLPDWCFGSRWLVSCFAHVSGATVAIDMSEIQLPNEGVIWEVGIYQVYANAANLSVRLGLSHVLPASLAEFMLLEPLVPGFGSQGPSPRAILTYHLAGPMYFPLRRYVEAQGKRLCLLAAGVQDKEQDVHAWAIVSSMPKEVPDWLVSGKVNVQ